MGDRGTWSKNVESKLDKAGLTQPGKDWLVMSLDPFPDREHSISGMPDGAAGRSIVLQYNQTLTIRKPPGLAEGAPWDLHVAFIPDLLDPVSSKIPDPANRDFTGVLLADDGRLLAETNNTFPWRGPLSIVAVPTGTATFPGSETFVFDPATSRIDGFNMKGFVGPQSRVIGGGVECENTTQELTVSGGVSYYTIPTENVKLDTAYNGLNGGTNLPSIRTLTSSRAPPATVAAAMSIPGSIRRKAKEGAYIPFRISKGQPNPPIDPQRSSRSFMGSAPYFAAVGSVVQGFGTRCENWETIAEFQPVPLLPFSQPLPFDISGAYFSGMSDTSTIDVTLRLFIETFPTSTTETLVSATDPAPADDPVAMELYSRVCRELPPGVEVKYNANGGWFKSLMSTIGAVAPTIGSALGTVIPGAGLIGKGVGGVAELLSGIKLGEKAQKEVDMRKKGMSQRARKTLDEYVEEPTREMVRVSAKPRKPKVVSKATRRVAGRQLNRIRKGPTIVELD